MGAAAGAMQTVPRRTIEALFRPEGIPVTPALKDELLAAGLDLDRLAATCPLPLLRLAFDIARRHAFPALPRADGFRQVGRAFVNGFKQTPIGWVFRAMAPVFGPDRTIQTLPRYLSAVREDMPLQVTAVGERRYELSSSDANANPHFLAGCLEGVLETAGAKRFTVDVSAANTDGFTLDIRWQA
jgi:uncharacterized protein (TIGR02265 family)